MKRVRDSRVINKRLTNVLGEYIDSHSITTLTQLIGAEVPDYVGDFMRFKTWMRDTNLITKQYFEGVQDLGTAAGRAAFQELNGNIEAVRRFLGSMWSMLVDHYDAMRRIAENKLAMGWSIASSMLILIARVTLIIECCVCIANQSKSARKRHCGCALPFIQLTWDDTVDTAPGALQRGKPVPTELLRTGRSFKTLFRRGCIMYPDSPIGAYTQYQLYQQMRLLIDNASWLSVEDAVLRDYLGCLFLRFCELICTQFHYGAPELNMGADYRSSSIYCGIRDDATRRRRITIDTNGGGSGSLVDMDGGASDEKMERLKREGFWQSNNRFVGEVMGMMMGFKRVMYIFHTQWKHDPPMSLEETRDFGARLLSLLLYQRTGASASRTERDEYPMTSASRPPARLDQRKRHVIETLLYSMDPIGDERERFDRFMKNFETTLDVARDEIVDQVLRDRVAVDCRLTNLPMGCVERAAFLAGHENESDTGRIEELLTPHIALTYLVNKWPEKPLSFFAEPHHGNAVRMCMYAHVFNKLTLDGDKRSRWLELNYLTDGSLRNGSYARRIRSSNPMPFMLTVLGDLYVVHCGRLYVCSTPAMALAMWCLICASIHRSRYENGPDVQYMRYLDDVLDEVFVRMEHRHVTNLGEREMEFNARLVDQL